MEKEISGTCINLDMFRCSVTVFVGPDKDTILKGLPKIFKEWKTPKNVIDEVFPEIKEALEDEKRLYKGTCIHSGVDATIIILDDNIYTVSYETAVHELYHAMHYICEVHGVDDEETEAYMLEYLWHNFLNAQDEYKEKHLKKNKKKK